MAGWRLEHTYTTLPQLFYSPAAPTPVRSPHLVAFNRPLATMLGLDGEALDGPDGAAIFAGNALPDGARPLAQGYAGHQFGHFTALGDGRAILLGEQVTPSGDRFDIQLIPFTLEHTSLRQAKVHDRVNLECDMVGKYVIRAASLAGLSFSVGPEESRH